MTVVGRQSWGTTIFCDDIRMEVGNKPMLIGIYPADMVVHAPFPFVAPKLGLWIRYFEVPGSQTEDGKLRVWFPGEETPTIEADLALIQLRATAPKNPERDNPELDNWIHLQMPILLSPVLLKQAGFIKVRLYFDETEIRLGALHVTAGEIPR